MADIGAFLNIVKSNPEAIELMDERKISAMGITSAELEKIKTLDPATVRMAVDAIDVRLRVSPVAGTNACPGTFACFGKSGITKDSIKEIIGGIGPEVR